MLFRFFPKVTLHLKRSFTCISSFANGSSEEVLKGTKCFRLMGDFHTSWGFFCQWRFSANCHSLVDLIMVEHLRSVYFVFFVQCSVFFQWIILTTRGLQSPTDISRYLLHICYITYLLQVQDICTMLHIDTRTERRGIQIWSKNNSDLLLVYIFCYIVTCS